MSRPLGRDAIRKAGLGGVRWDRLIRLHWKFVETRCKACLRMDVIPKADARSSVHGSSTEFETSFKELTIQSSPNPWLRP